MFQILSSPLKIKHLLLPNRIAVPAMHTNLASPDGLVTEAMISHYQRRAQGGAGLVVVEVAAVQFPLGRQSLSELRIDIPACLPGLTRLAAAVKHAGAACFLQLFHAGAQTAPHFTDGENAVSPSGIPVRVIGNSPRPLEISEIMSLRDSFIQAGIWAAEAGFDGVELHAAHGYLLSEFLSPYTNQRTDCYGADTRGRSRLLTEIISGIKQRVPSLIISVRMNGDDFLPGGINTNEAEAIARLLEAAGADMLNISAGMYDSGLTSIESNAYAEGWRLHLSAAVKAAVAIPVIGGGVILEPAMAETALKNQTCDLIYIGRASMADFDWPNKALNDAAPDIRPCIRCNTCIDVSFAGGPIRCAVNPLVGGPADERDPERSKGHFYWLNRDALGKSSYAQGSRLMVIGSGPAGMMAALLGAEHGFEVTLIEKDNELGGLLKLASFPPHKGRILKFRDYLITNLTQAGIKLITGQTATSQLIKEMNPDLVVAAIGSRDLELPVAVDTVPAISIAEALTGDYQDQRCLIVGGGETGLETAQVLARQGAAVTVIEKSPIWAGNMEKKNRRSLLNSLKELPVTLWSRTTFLGIKDGQALVSSPAGEMLVNVDYIIPAWGREPLRVPQDWLDLGLPILVLGDAAHVSSIAGATRAACLAFADLPYKGA